jgi:CDP-paratose 2-epimerase
MKKIIVTGSSGLIGSEVVTHFSSKGWEVHGIDNNQRAIFFGPNGDTRWNQKRLEKEIKNFYHHEADIRDRSSVDYIIKKISPDAIVHTAAQPSHDRAASIPFADFDTNAVGTLNLLEATRRHRPDCVFVHMSTNKVYGDGPNNVKLKEAETRWEIDDERYKEGIPETFSIDQCKHSLFGASKVAADIIVQEYGRYFGMKTCCLRGGCLTGPNHSGVELHGFLSYLTKCCLEEKPYTIFGYKGKQVRDNIHSKDVALFIDAFIENPRCGEVYNLGGGIKNTCSIIEAVEIIKNVSGKSAVISYSDTPRIGDHICYYSDLRKIKEHYPNWDITISLEDTIKEIIDSHNKKCTSENRNPISLLSIIIPARNEEAVIEETILETNKILSKAEIVHEIVVVDDGSTDQTWEVLSKLNTLPELQGVLRPIKNLGENGIGRAISKGIDSSNGDGIIIAMADGSDSPEDMIKYWEKLNDGYDCVFGSRFIKGGKVIDYPWMKLVINRLANAFIRVLFNHSLNDTTNAFKAYKRSVIEGISPILSPHFNITVELPLKSIVRGYTYTVVPISWKNRKAGESKLKIKEMGSRYLFICLSVWLEKYFSRGDYQKRSK